MKALRRWSALLALGCTGTIGGMSGGPSGEPGAPADVEVPGARAPAGCDLPNLFAANGCTGCHDRTPGVEGGNLDLLSAGVAERMRDVLSANARCQPLRLVDTSDSESSMLLRLVDPERYDAWGDDACIEMMPFGMDGVAPDQIACFEAWVADVAAGGTGVVRDIGEDGAPRPTPTERVGPAPFDPQGPGSALAKAKMVLHGGSPTAEELEMVRAPDGSIDFEGLRSVIAAWFDSAPFERKARAFLRLALQQHAEDSGRPFREQLGGIFGDNSRPLDRRRFVAMVEDSFIHTAWDIVESRRDFREILTTRRWQVTTAMLAALAYADLDRQPPQDDRFRNFGHLQPSDYSDWRVVELTQARSPADVLTYENRAGFASSVRAVRAGDEFPLVAPRVGFFNTPSFFDTWKTNEDNQFRVSTSQAVINALDLVFEAGDPTEPLSLAGLAEDHAAPETACYRCHRQLDPMRQVFLRYYNFDMRGAASVSNRDGGVALQGHRAPVRTMDDFAAALAEHPRFGTAWVQKLCMWASSQRCEDTDPELQRIAARFDASHDFLALVVDVFSSPLVTGASLTQTHGAREFIVSASRANHVCDALEIRMEEAQVDRCDAEPRSPACDGGGGAGSCNALLAAALSEDGFTRGSRDFVQSVLPGPFTARALNKLCASMAQDAVGGAGSAAPFNVSDAPASLERMVRTIMGLPPAHRRYEAAREALERYYAIGVAETRCGGEELVEANRTEVNCGLRESPQNALKMAFEMACSSPELAGVGL